MFLNDGAGSRYDAEKAVEILRVASLKSLNLPDNKIDVIPLLNVTIAVEETISELKPDVIDIHHMGT